MSMLFPVVAPSDNLDADWANSYLALISEQIAGLKDGSIALAAPTISAFTNAQHNHSNAAQGGLIPHTSVSTGAAVAASPLQADGSGGVQIGTPASVTLPTGIVWLWSTATAPTGWLLANGFTIGSAASGATARANADTQNLYELLWASWPNSVLPIQDSGGSASTRGATAAADFSANKRLPLPDLRGRMPIGNDNMGGSSANRVTAASADVMGGSGGAENHTLSIAELPAHTHSVLAQGSFATAGGGPSAGDGVTTTNTGSTGSGNAHNNMPPYIALSYIIKL